MSKYIGPKNKIARRFGINLGLKSNSNKVTRRLNQMPGVHGPKKRSNRSGSSFSKQLIEKQKAKSIYNIRERQFRRYVNEAIRLKGDSGINLQRLLELRLDNIVYRLGFAITRAQARQMVNHGMFMVNDKKLNIPSHLCKSGDKISLRENKQKKKLFEDLDERLAKVDLLSWLSLDLPKRIGSILNVPDVQDFDKVFDVKFIIEYYSIR